jgi:p-hydroxybenzoate 3-monooxygenase
VYLRVRGKDHYINFRELTGGRTITVCAQQEVVKDLIALRLATGGSIVFEAEYASLHEIEGPKPYIGYSKNGKSCEIHCEFIAGCDGFHGVSRPSIPHGVLKSFDKVYPFA